MTKIYKRLPGRGNSFASKTPTARFSIWLGPDHMLQIYNFGYTEEYKRFYFRDIQAFVLRKTPRGHVVNLISGLLGAGFIFLWISTPSEALGVVSGIFGIPLALIFIFNLLLGSTCECRLYTAVQTEPLPSISRLRAARKTIALLKPLIEQAQGTISNDELKTRSSVDFAAGSPLPHAAPRSLPIVGTKPVVHYGGTAHATLFAFLLIQGVLVGMDFFQQALWLFVCNNAAWLGIGGCAIWAMVKQINSDITPALKRMVWCSFGYFWIYLFAGYFYFIFMAIQHPKLANDQMAFVKMVAKLSPMDSMFLTVFELVLLGLSLLLGALGFRFLADFRARARTGPPPVAAQPAPKA